VVGYAEKRILLSIVILKILSAN